MGAPGQESVLHFALSRITLTEYGGKSCTNFGPAASTAARRGAAFSGSASVLTSPGLPDRTSAVAPFSTSLTPCKSIASFWTSGDVLTTFRMTSPVASTRLAPAKTGPSGAAGGLVPSLTSLSSRKQRTFLPSTSTRTSYQRPVSTFTG